MTACGHCEVILDRHCEVAVCRHCEVAQLPKQSTLGEAWIASLRARNDEGDFEMKVDIRYLTQIFKALCQKVS